MTILYDWQYIQESWDVEAGKAARQHTEESSHNDHYLLSYGPTVTCVHAACDPEWSYNGRGPE